MSTNGPAVPEARLSLDSERSSNTPSPPATSNGSHLVNGKAADEDRDLDPISRLQQELERTKEEKESLASQYRNLLAKLTTMRTSLGNKLKQDAEELDRREQLVQQLTAQNEDLTNTIETLKAELIASHEEAERSAQELDNIRSRALLENAQEHMLRERELRETQTELERCRMERDEWERIAQQERIHADELKSTLEVFKRDLELERENRERLAAELEVEQEKTANLQSVLQDFQAAKDHELRQAVKDHETQLTQVTQSLAEFKSRALTAEVQLEETKSDSSRTRELEKEVKEKNLLIGKLRHEAVIINEHLMEALRRLRRNSSEVNVDRRLVTNVLLSFLTTPRTDTKRFEILGLLATILSWSDAEREKAGLQRTQGHANNLQSSGSTFWNRSSSGLKPELEKTDETESFSRLWVEFLLTEASGGDPNSTPPTRNTSLPGSPTASSHPVSPSLRNGRRLSSLSSAGMSSSPNLMLGSPPLRNDKGKEKVPS